MKHTQQWVKWVLKQQLKRERFLSKSVGKCISRVFEGQAGKLSTPRGLDGTYTTGEEATEDQSKATFLQNVKQADGVLQVLQTVSLIWGAVMEQLIQELCITIQKEQTQTASSHADLQEIDFTRCFLFVLFCF